MKNITEIIPDTIRYAILTRQKKTQQAYIILPKVFDHFGLDFISVAQRRIAEEEKDTQFFMDHIKINLKLNHYWLDKEALVRYKGLLLDFMDEEQYNNIIEILKVEDEKNNADSSILQYYQRLGLRELIKSYMLYKKNYKQYQEEEMYLKEWGRLELLSRIPPVWLYWQIIKLIDKLRLQIQVKKFIKNRKEVDE